MTKLMALVAQLIRRPMAGERPLPLVFLVGQAQGRAFLAALAGQRLGGTASRRVPHVHVSAEDAGTDVRQLLRTVRQELALDKFGGERLKFSHFPLLDWLMDLNLDTERPGDALARELRNRLAKPWNRETGTQVAESVPGTWQRLLLVVLWFVVPSAVYRTRISGRIPGVGREFRWFMRQQYLAPRQSASFLGFAERLTVGPRHGENQSQVDKLLVHAFLEDLRRAYVRRPWRVHGWRRTAYPLVLLDECSGGTSGQRLLQLINDVRNETGRHDPLLVVGAADALPPNVPDDRVVAAEEVWNGYEEWQEEIGAARRARDTAAWYLPVTAPAPVGSRRLTSHDLAMFVPNKPRWWARRATPLVAAVVVLASIGGCVHVRNAQHQDVLFQHCGVDDRSGRVSVQLQGSECVGYSDGFVFSGSEERVRSAQRRLFDQNRQAEDELRKDPGRTFVTLVYLGQLSGVPSTVAESEELEGLAIAQHDALGGGSRRTLPLLRVIVANAGSHMQHAARAVQMLEPHVRADPSIVGVVGLDESRTSTVDAIRALSRLGLPMIAPTLSADGMYEKSPLYYQIVPPNRRQADLVLAYAASQGVRNILVYYKEFDDDLYTKSLRDAVRNSPLLAKYGIRVEAVHNWHADPNSLEHARGYPGMVFYAGRWNDFSDFLSSLEQGAPPSLLMADDAVNRFVADSTERKNTRSGLPLVYVSKSSLATCQNLAPRSEQRQRFLTLATELLRACDPGTAYPLGERTGLAYDAAKAFFLATQRLVMADASSVDPSHSTPPWRPVVGPAAIAGELNRMGAFDGVTGVIDFAKGQEPYDKRLALLRVEQIKAVDIPPRPVFACGPANTAGPVEQDGSDRESPGCP